MSNELIFIITVLIDLGFVLALSRLGRIGLVASVVVNVILVSVFGAELVPVFGFITNSANVFYASIFLAVNILVEQYGRREGLKAVGTGFAALVLFIIMSQFVLYSAGSPDTTSVNDAIRNLFRVAPRIAFASMFAYLLVQNFNAWFFDLLRQKQGRNFLWLRNISSTSIAQLIDSIIFFPLAFYGTIPDSVLIQSMLVGFVLKAVIAVISTPFLYASRGLKHDPVPEFPATYDNARPAAFPGKQILTDPVIINQVKIISFLVAIAGILVAYGWVFDIPVLTYFITGSVSMTFSVAVSFIFSGLIIFFILQSLEGKKDLASVVLPIATLVVVLFMVTFLAGSLFTISLGFQDLFYQDPGSPEVPDPGVPSVATMLAFILIAGSGLLTLLNPKYLTIQLRILGSGIGLIGLSALAGYSLGLPLLYFYLPNISNPMALLTAILFTAVGYCLFILGQDKHEF